MSLIYHDDFKPISMQNLPDLQELSLRQVDGELAKWRMATLPSPPPIGWIRTIRESLGMTAAALAKRLDMTGAGLRGIEISEADERITLATLRKVADALDCDLRYALVPRQSLGDKLMSRAKNVVAEQMGHVAHSMALEDQKVNDRQAMDRYLESAARSLIRRSPRSLW